MTANGYVILVQNSELPDDVWLSSQGISTWITSGDLREAHIFTDKEFVEHLIEDKSDEKRTLTVYKVSLSLDRTTPILKE